MSAKWQRVIKISVDILVLVIGLFILSRFLLSTQTALSIKRQEENFKTKLDIAQQRMEQNAAEAEDNLKSYDEFNQAKLDSVVHFLDGHPDYPRARALARQWGLSEFYIIDADGNMSFSIGVAPDMSAEPFPDIIKAVEPVTFGDIRYYTSPMSNGSLAIGAREFKNRQLLLDGLRSAQRALETIKVGANGFILAMEAEEQTIVYAPQEGLIGKTASAAGLSPSVLTNDWEGWISLDGSDFYAKTRVFGEYIFTAAVPGTEMSSANQSTVILVLLVFAAAMLLMIAYALILQRDEATNPLNAPEYIQLAKHLYFNKTMGAKIRNIAAICLIAVFALSFYMQTLSALSRQSIISFNKLEDVSSILDNNFGRIVSLKNEYADEYSGRAQNVAWTLNEDVSLINDEALAEMAEHAQISAIYVFDKNGNTVATNTPYKDFTLSGDQASQSYPFWSVVKGYTTVYVQDAQPDDTMEANLMQYVGVSRLDDKGMVQLGMLPRRLKSRLAATEQDYVLHSIAVENGGFIFAVNKVDGTFLTYPKSKYVGRPASEYGLSADALRDEFSGYQTIEGTKYFVACTEYDDAFIYTAVPTDRIFSGRLNTALIVTAGSLVVMLVICAFLLLSRKMHEQETSENPNDAKDAPKPQPRRFFHVVSPGGKSRVVQSASSRWSGSSAWRDMTPEQKLSRIFSITISIAALAMVLWMASGRAQSDSIFAYILSTNWERTPNIFSLTYILMIAVETLVISGILRKLILFATSRFGARSETVGRLLDSFIKYVAVIGIVFYGLDFIGIDSTTLMTSAGILALVVGLGAQKLIGDILAGIFIVFEGEFRVGDIVTVGDWCGTVLEIGIRTTKIQNGGSDIKIISNSAISGVVNMTKQFSYASVDIGIEYGESLEHVESILNKELPLVKNKIPSIVAGPYYKGVASLGDSAVVIRIVAQCQEKDRIQLGRDLNRELKLICDRNNISIPFPQVVINRPVEHEQATRAEKREAAAFVEEQKELTKDIHVEEEP